jgi:hypothetical protein
VEVDRTFVSALIDNGERHKVLGVTLLPFSAWHLFLLQVSESPFLKAGEVYLYHLRRAVGICRLRYRASRTRPPFFPLFMNQKKLEIEVKKFMVYIEDYLQRPEYNIMPIDEFRQPSRVSRTPSPAPDVVQLAFDAAHGANVSISEAWNMPVGEAYIAQAMYYKTQGLQVDFMTEDEREFQEELKKHLEARNGEK